MMSQSHGIKGGTTNKAFQERQFLWESGAPISHTSTYKKNEKAQKVSLNYMLQNDEDNW